MAKNRLLKIAADEAGLVELKPMLDGPTAIATTGGDEVTLARALQDAFRPYKLVTLRGGLLAGQPVDGADLQRLAGLPSREVLLSRLAGGMAAPLTGMAAVLAANLRNLVGVLNAVADQRRQTEAPEDSATAETSDRAETAVAEPTESADEADTAEPVDPADDFGPPASAESTDDPPAEADSAEDAEASATD